MDPEHSGREVEGSGQVRSDDGLGRDPDVLLGGETHLPRLPQDFMAFFLSGVKYEYSVLSPLQLIIENNYS